MRERIKKLMQMGVDPLTAREQVLAEIRQELVAAQTVDDIKRIMLDMFSTD